MDQPQNVRQWLEALGFDPHADHDQNIRTALAELHARRKAAPVPQQEQ